jgi:biopolymer transport protein ExbB
MNVGCIWFFGALACLVSSLPATAQADPSAQPKSLDELLERVRRATILESEESSRREREFRSTKAEQERLLTDALVLRAAEEQRSAELELAFEGNEKEIPEVEATLQSRMGTLGELFGVVRQVAGDTRAQLESSLVSAQFPDRTEFLGELAQTRDMPTVEEMDRLWFLLQQEMTESGKVVRFPATVIAVGGGESIEPVVRVGPFNAVADGRYLQYLPESGKLAELGRQPRRRDLSTVRDLESAKDGLVGFSIDPSRGSLLSLLIQTPSQEERVQQGGAIGYVIIGLGLLGLVVAAYRLVELSIVGRRIRAQVGASTANPDNPLGRILAVYENHRKVDAETLELKLDEVIIKEGPALERGTSILRVISVVSPLLGLLGTITGMIATFQAITLFGTGDPKLMASGISEALVTTMLGLLVAIPITLLHSFVSGRSQSLLQVLDEQSAGLIALRAEEHELDRKKGPHAIAS